MITILSLALLPVLILLVFIYYKDRNHPEPIKMLLKALGMGVLSVLISLAITSLQDEGADEGIAGFYDAFVGAALPEEFAKLLMLWLLVRKNKDFDEPMDGIVYAVFVSLGFAGFENILYLIGDDDLFTLAITRGIFSVPGHFCFGVCMGYFYALAHFGQKHKMFYYIMAYICPVVLHGLYDGFLALVGDDEYWWLCLVWLVFCVFMFISSIKRIKKVKEVLKAETQEGPKKA